MWPPSGIGTLSSAAPFSWSAGRGIGLTGAGPPGHHAPPVADQRGRPQASAKPLHTPELPSVRWRRWPLPGDEAEVAPRPRGSYRNGRATSSPGGSAMPPRHPLAGLVALAGLLVALPLLGADERLQGVACRSVHLRYAAPAGV